MDDDPTEPRHQRKRRLALVGLLLGLVALTLLASGLVFILAVSTGQSLYLNVGPVTFVSAHAPVIPSTVIVQMGGSASYSSTVSSSGWWSVGPSGSSACGPLLSGALGDGVFYVITC